MKKIIVTILILLSFLPSIILAKECSIAEITLEKSLAANINWFYEYYLKNNKMYFDVIVTNVFDDLYVKYNGKTYNQKEFTLTGLSDNQKLELEIYSKNCKLQVLTRDIYLPKYNTFHGTEYCKGISEFSYCGKWNVLGNSVTIEDLKVKTEEYRASLKAEEKDLVTYKTDIVGFYMFIALIITSILLFLFFLLRTKPKKDFI